MNPFKLKTIEKETFDSIISIKTQKTAGHADRREKYQLQ
jgi:hypothetical protein